MIEKLIDSRARAWSHVTDTHVQNHSCKFAQVGLEGLATG